MSGRIPLGKFTFLQLSTKCDTSRRRPAAVRNFLLGNVIDKCDVDFKVYIKCKLKGQVPDVDEVTAAHFSILKISMIFFLTWNKWILLLVGSKAVCLCSHLLYYEPVFNRPWKCYKNRKKNDVETSRPDLNESEHKRSINFHNFFLCYSDWWKNCWNSISMFSPFSIWWPKYISEEEHLFSHKQHYFLWWNRLISSKNYW